MTKLTILSFKDWEPNLNHTETGEIVTALEEGRLLYFPKLGFEIKEQEKKLFSPNLVKKGHKNISYNPKDNQLKACMGSIEDQKVIHEMTKRFSEAAQKLIHQILPSYEQHLEVGRTSFRPVEVLGRENASIRKDDTLLHLDSFPSSPTGGKRILRFFANVNPYDKPRVWKVGEPFDRVLRRFIPRIKKPVIGSRALLHRLGLTKSYRILYDHYMLNVHHAMKEDSGYQQQVEQQTLEFPSMTCWMCFTDQVSHAALSGQYVFEQSFYLPIEAQKFPEKSPLHYMEELFQKRLRN